MDKRWTFFSVDIELSSHCGTNCRFCPRDQFSRPQGIMSDDTLEAILRKIQPLKSRVTFCGMGNPLLNSRWPDYLKQFRKCGVSCGLVAHVRELTSDTVDALCEAKPNRLEISFPSLDRETFAKICETITYDEAHDNINSLISRQDRTFPITVEGVRSKLNPDEDENYTAHWSSLGIQSRIYSIHSRGGHLIDEELIDPLHQTEISKPCGLFAIHSFIAWNGDVLSCCHDLKGEGVIGNIATDSLEELMERKARILESTPHFDLCRSCDDNYRYCSIPDQPFPATPKKRSKFLKSWTEGDV